MMRRIVAAGIMAMVMAAAAFAQSGDAYEPGAWTSPPVPGGDDGAAPAGLLDPSRLTVSHSMSFMAGGSQISDVKSQSFYSTMFQYRFNAPVVLSLNFDMPIHSTFNRYNNFTSDNLSSFDYFRNMPIDAAVTWQPSEKFALGFRVIKMPESGAGFYNGGFYKPGSFYRGGW